MDVICNFRFTIVTFNCEPNVEMCLVVSSKPWKYKEEVSSVMTAKT